MSFNYGREEKKWWLWKEAEEKEPRGMSVDEDTIEKLHTYDWQSLKDSCGNACKKA